MIYLFVASEKESEELTNAEKSTHKDKETSEAQEDEGDWEQVGPRNKSMVTRMVRKELECTVPLRDKRTIKRVGHALIKMSQLVGPFLLTR